MSQIISIEFPDYLANSMRMNKSEFGKEIKISGLVKLFELGKISSGTASKVLQLLENPPSFCLCGIGIVCQCAVMPHFTPDASFAFAV